MYSTAPERKIEAPNSNAAGAATEPMVRFLYGKTRAEKTWTPVELSWPEVRHLFTNAKIGPKDGAAFAPGWTSEPGARTADRIERIDLLVLDADAGDQFDTVVDLVEKLGLDAVLYTTHSHLKTETAVIAAHWQKWASELGEDATPGGYLSLVKGMRQEIVADAVLDRIEGERAIFQHLPCPRFRVVVRLAKPWRVTDYATAAEAQAKFKAAVAAVAHALNLQHDENCENVNAMFYLPRVADEAALADFRGKIVDGEPWDVWSLPPAPGADSNDALHGNQGAVRPPIVFDVEDYPKVQAMMAAMPNPAGLDRNAAVGIAHALRVAMSENLDLAEKIFLEWESRWDSGNTPGEGQRIWDSTEAGEHYGNGRTLLRLARENGVNPEDYGINLGHYLGGAFSSADATADPDVAGEPGSQGWRKKLKRYKNHNGKFVIEKSLDNVMLALEEGARLAGTVRREVAKDAPVICVSDATRIPWEPGGELLWEQSGTQVRELGEDDLFDARRWLQREKLGAGKDVVFDALNAIAGKDQFSAVEDYLRGLVWDGTSRLDQLLTDYCGAEDTRRTREVGKRWCIGAVARALEPGCQMDTMLILAGPQGVKKTRFFRTLARHPAWFNESSIGRLGSKESQEGQRGKWIVELGEMGSLRRSDIEASKQFLTNTNDHYRAPYARYPATHARRSVFAGSLNPGPQGLNRDVTGSRRLWLVEVIRVNISRLEADVDQLWAEAVSLYLRRDRWWFDDANPADAELWRQSEAAVDKLDSDDPKLELVRKFIKQEPISSIGGQVSWKLRPTPLTVIGSPSLILAATGIVEGRITSADTGAVGGAFRKLKWTRVQLKKPMVGLPRDARIYVTSQAPDYSVRRKFDAWMAEQVALGKVDVGTKPPQPATTTVCDKEVAGEEGA